MEVRQPTQLHRLRHGGGVTDVQPFAVILIDRRRTSLLQLKSQVVRPPPWPMQTSPPSWA